MKKRKCIVLLLSALFLFSCNANVQTSSSSFSSGVNSSLSSVPSSSTSTASVTASSSASSSSSNSLIIPSGKENPNYNENENIEINLANGETTVLNNNGFIIFEDEKVWILKGGTYSLKGEFNGQVIINCPEEEVELDLNGVTISSSSGSPLLILEADECDISAKKGTTNTIDDTRDEVEDYAAAIYSDCDLNIKGKGSLTVNSSNNKGIHCKDDLEIKNLTLYVKSSNDAIRGNDSLTLEKATVTAISTKGDGLKTKNSDISSKGNQRGTITIQGGKLDVYAATDAIDASYNVSIDGSPEINCYTSKYSEYSEEVDEVSSDTMYLKIDRSLVSKKFYLVFTLQDGSEKFVKASSSSVGFDRSTYYTIDVPNNAQKVMVYVYDNEVSAIDSNYLYKTEQVTLNSELDCLSLSLRGNKLNTDWSKYTNYSYGPGGHGGFDDGNSEKSTYSNKGIKADNLIEIASGTINIKSHDDAIHANGDEELENGEDPLGNIVISGGDLTLYSDDDAIHADYKLDITGGNIEVTHSYEGFEGNIITISGGVSQISSSDDGINATYFKESALIDFQGGITYLNADGDGIDSNGYVKMSGGYVLAIGPSNGGNGVLDYDNTFVATGGYLLAIGCSGMDQKVTASGDAKSGTQRISTSVGQYLSLTVDSTTIIEFKIPKSNLNYCVYSYVGSSCSVGLNSSPVTSIDDALYFVANS